MNKGNPTGKTPEEIVREVNELRATGIRVTEACKKVGVHYTTYNYHDANLRRKAKAEAEAQGGTATFTTLPTEKRNYTKKTVNKGKLAVVVGDVATIREFMGGF